MEWNKKEIMEKEKKKKKKQNQERPMEIFPFGINCT